MTVTDAARSADVELDVVPLSGTIGAVIRGLDLPNITDAQVAAVRKVWLERKVVFFPEGGLDPESHVAFAGRFGTPTEGHPVIPGLKEQPSVFEIDYSAARELEALYGDVARKQVQGLDWHTDVTFVKRPPLGSILRAVTIPLAGGDTAFSDQQAAFEALSPSLQAYLETLTAVHNGETQFRGILDLVGEGKWEGEAFTKLEPSVHPVVRTHPETGKRVLFVNPGFTSHIVELNPTESQALLAFLYAHSVRPEFTVRYHWTEGDIGFWDNRVTQHSVVGDWGTQPRLIQRVTLRGDEPV
jgi:alpha-ketoglutarate-dependent taurine dioxygenase